jgi:hypothetical protein
LFTPGFATVSLEGSLCQYPHLIPFVSSEVEVEKDNMHIFSLLLCATAVKFGIAMPVEAEADTLQHAAPKRDLDISINYDLLNSRDSNVLACRIVGYSGDKCDDNQGSAIQIPKSVEGMHSKRMRE